MKKISTLLIAATCAVCAMAESDATVAETIAGTYQMASEGNCAYFKNYNPIENDELMITASSDGETVAVSYSNEAWGSASFESVAITETDGGYALEGDGTLSMAMNGNAPKQYAATFTATIDSDGKMLLAQIYAPSVMGGFSIDFTPSGGTSGIHSLSATSTESGSTFDLSGRRTDASYKGIVIRGGKMIIQK